MASHTLLIYYYSIIIVTFTCFCYLITAQQPYSANNCPVHDNATTALGYTCNGANTSCQSYLIYRTIPPYNTISSIASLLSVNKSELSAINNNISKDMVLETNVDMIVPVTCSCSSTTYYQAKTTYIVQTGETYCTLTNNTFRGLTTCNAFQSEKYGPNIYYIYPNDKLIVRLRCACPATRQVNDGIRYLLSYVIHEKDTIRAIANKFGANFDQTLQANEISSEQDSGIAPWTTLLVPLQQPPNGSQMNYTFVEKHHKRSSEFYILVVCVPVAVVVFILFGACYFTFRYKRTTVSPDGEVFNDVESLRYDFKTIRDATDNFSQRNKLGQGGFGVVYKGLLESGQEIAVKRLSINSGQGIEEFKTEVVLIEKLKHNNLVKLLGFCIHKEEKLLVYEHLPNASLDKILRDEKRQAWLDWEARYKILLGTARGLLYLHEDSRLKIIHRDLKPSNILLDENMNPKIADFGLARLVGRDQSQADTSKIAGTYGYMAPEYALSGRFSKMSDVYSFGVIALEVISGHVCSTTTFPYEDESLCLQVKVLEFFFQSYFDTVICSRDKNMDAWRLWKDGAISDLVDPRLNGSYISDEVTRCVHIGLLCIQEDAKKRPTMASIVSALRGHPVVLFEPEPPYGPLIDTPHDSSLQHLKFSDGASKNMDSTSE